MNFERFIAGKIINTNGQDKINSLKINAAPVIKIAIAGISIAFVVMLLAVCILFGFKDEIQSKVRGFNGDITISNYNESNTIENLPIDFNDSVKSILKGNEEIKSFYPYALKPGIIKTGKAIEGIVFKGVDENYNYGFFKEKMLSGVCPTNKNEQDNNDVIISQYTAQRLKLKTGNNIWLYFVQNPPRTRKLTITGIYETGLEDFDKLYVFGNVKIIQKLNNWNAKQFSGIEVSLRNANKVDEVNEDINSQLSYTYLSKTAKESYPQIFDWLALQDINVQVILILMAIVAAINMSSALLILIIENTNKIGILKALGANNFSVRKIFFYNAVKLIGKGLLWGNLIGLTLCLSQMYFHFIPLDQKSYYMPYVPIQIDLITIAFLNIGTIVFCSLVLILPTYVVTQISPVKAIRFS